MAREMITIVASSSIRLNPPLFVLIPVASSKRG